MYRSKGFTLVEMLVSSALFLSGAVYIYATLAGVTQNGQSTTVQIDLGSQNKKAMTSRLLKA